MNKGTEKQNAQCDYCRADLGCKEDSPESLGYWRTQYALYVCDECLSKCSSDFPDKEGIERRFALRALHVRGVDLDDSAARVEWNTTTGLHGLVALMPEIVRDGKRQDGTRKPKRPWINEWIGRQLKRDATAKSPALWNDAPERIKDVITYGPFAKRVTEVRKLRRK